MSDNTTVARKKQSNPQEMMKDTLDAEDIEIIKANQKAYDQIDEREEYLEKNAKPSDKSQEQLVTIP